MSTETDAQAASTPKADAVDTIEAVLEFARPAASSREIAEFLVTVIGVQLTDPADA